jgi:hypothetical protein
LPELRRPGVRDRTTRLEVDAKAFEACDVRGPGTASSDEGGVV